ncbi:MAG: type VI secretion system TssO [Chitinophagaceae bacterium]
MKSLNASQRENALWQFFLFFLLSTGFIVATVVMGMQVPFRQNDLLKKHLAMYQRQRLFMDTFSARMIDTQNLLDSVNRPGVQAELIDGQIADNLRTMNSMIVADSTIPKAVYTSIVGNFANLKDAKQQLRSAGNNDQTINTLKQQLATYQSQLQQAQLTIATLNAAH